MTYATRARLYSACNLALKSSILSFSASVSLSSATSNVGGVGATAAE